MSELPDVDTGEPELRALQLIRRGLAVSPELRDGLVATVLLGIAVAASRLAVPVVVELAIDDGVDESGSVNFSFIFAIAAVALATVAAGWGCSYWAERRLAQRAATAIANLRIATFDRIHAFSMSDLNESRRGVLVSRVTSDAEQLSRFAQWGMFVWAVEPVVIVGIVTAMAFYSWQLTLLVILVYLPVWPVLRILQRRQLKVYDQYRSRVGDMLASFSEILGGAAVIRAYGAEQRFNAEVNSAITERYRARLRANGFVAGMYVVGDLFSLAGYLVVLVVGLWQRQAWGIDAGDLVAMMFLVSLLQPPLSELSEVLDQAQIAAASWGKILSVLDHPVDVTEPERGHHLPAGALSIDVEDLDFTYRGGERALQGVSVTIPAGLNVAVVGATGSGKTTFVKLLCRLADPVSGTIRVGGHDLREVDADSRIGSIRMVPQDGFLFDASIAENVLMGDHASEFGFGDVVDEASVEGYRRVRAAFDQLGLGWWLDRHSLDEQVGQRGENLSVGERQLIALARAQLADPGVLVLDEATSAVDPEIDQALTEALRRLAVGRTMISVAHRLSTSETADLVLVFDRGQLAESGSHSELVDGAGIYADLHRAWIGNTRAAR